VALRDASASIPQVDLTGLITSLAPSNVTITNIIVTSPKYLKDLSGLLSNTTTDVLQGFFLWKTVESLAGSIQGDAIAPFTRFLNEISGKVRAACRLLVMNKTR